MRVVIEAGNSEISIETPDGEMRYSGQSAAVLKINQEPCDENKWTNTEIAVRLSEYQLGQLEAALRLLT